VTIWKAVQIRLFASIPESNEEVIKKDTSVKSQFKRIWNRYGFLAIGTYAALYITTLGSIFISLDLNIFDATTFGFDPEIAVLKVCDFVESLTGNRDFPGYIRQNPRVGTFALAWIMTKVTEPLRLAITLAVLPQMARMLGRKNEESPAA